MNNLVPLTLKNVFRKVAQSGGRAWLVGGCVRDMLLGQQPIDWDVEVYGLDEQVLQKELRRLGHCEHVGKHFGVYKLWLNDVVLDVALPRKEKKSGVGHTQFDIVSDPFLLPEQASLRRDFTINAMMYDPLSDSLLDFHEGQNDLAKKVLRHVSPAFAEDPLRPLRAMQFAARFGFVLDKETQEMCKVLLPEAKTLPQSRIWQEWLKWSKADYPSFGLQALHEIGWDSLYPELISLQGCVQDAYWHPEGDVWAHTCLVMDEAALLSKERQLSDESRLILMFAALCHDLGKPMTTYTDEKGNVVSPKHGKEGVVSSVSFLKRIGAPRRTLEHIKPLVAEHVAHFSRDISEREVRCLAKRLEPSNIQLWEILTQADANGRHPAPRSRPAEAWLNLAEVLGVESKKEVAIVTGELLVTWGMRPSPAMGDLLKKAYDAQLNNEFKDEITAKLWYKKYAVVS
ncbi:MAG: CCA tRNA nucleotidyltransferase [Ghiorsea sp.]